MSSGGAGPRGRVTTPLTDPPTPGVSKHAAAPQHLQPIRVNSSSRLSLQRQRLGPPAAASNKLRSLSRPPLEGQRSGGLNERGCGRD